MATLPALAGSQPPLCRPVYPIPTHSQDSPLAAAATTSLRCTIKKGHEHCRLPAQRNPAASPANAGALTPSLLPHYQSPLALRPSSPCTRRSACTLLPFPDIPPSAPMTHSQDAIIDANQATALHNGQTLFTGEVTLVKGQKRLRADRVRYNRNNGDIFAQGDLQFALPSVQVRGPRGHFSVNTRQGVFYNGEYRLLSSQGRGTADEIQLLGAGKSTLDNVVYTTCPIGSNDWQLTASSVDLDQKADQGTAYNAVLWFYHVPIFYSPFISFPLSDQRKTGFLSPTIGYSQHNGLEIIEPYYINIAPFMDATLIGRYIGRRGTQMTGQLRYLFPGTKGNLSYSLLPHDKLRGARRSRFHFGNSSRLGDYWRIDANINHISDAYYFTDLGSSNSDTRTLYQIQRLRGRFSSSNWSFSAMAQTYQTLTASLPPYRILPRFTGSWHPMSANPRLSYGASSQLVRFAYPRRVGASRMHLEPHFSYTFGNYKYAWHIKPKIKWDLTGYRLNNVHTPRPTHLSRSAPILSLDSGLTLMRDTYFGDMVETLEPRLYYLYIPYRDQSNFPLFDTGTATFNFSQLYSDNRYTGLDRLGDTNQLSYGLTTRFIKPDSGRELLSASIGQIRYFDDRRVRRHGGGALTRERSDLIGELSVNLAHAWSAKAFTQWNPRTHKSDVRSVQLQYRPGSRRVINMAYRYKRHSRKETDVSFAWPIANNWQLVGRWQYSLRDQKTREMFYGFQYENCCWAFVFLNRRYLRRGSNLAQSFYMEIQFKGLGRLGRDIIGFIKNGIVGYGG